jgi:hypothetical protein
MSRLALIILITITSFSTNALSEDGTYDALVTTQSGTYTVPVEVENGEVTSVQWPNGGNMHVYGGDIDNGEVTGASNSRGDFINIEIDDSSYDENGEP